MINSPKIQWFKQNKSFFLCHLKCRGKWAVKDRLAVLTISSVSVLHSWGVYLSVRSKLLTQFLSAHRKDKGRDEDKQLPLKNVTRKSSAPVSLVRIQSHDHNFTVTEMGNSLLYLGPHVPFQNCGREWDFVIKERMT